MTQQSTVFFHMYKPDQFVRYAEQNLALTASPNAIQEIREVSTQHQSLANASFDAWYEPRMKLRIAQRHYRANLEKQGLIKDVSDGLQQLQDRLAFIDANQDKIAQAFKEYDALQRRLSQETGSSSEKEEGDNGEEENDQ